MAAHCWPKEQDPLLPKAHPPLSEPLHPPTRPRTRVPFLHHSCYSCSRTTSEVQAALTPGRSPSVGRILAGQPPSCCNARLHGSGSSAQTQL